MSAASRSGGSNARGSRPPHLAASREQAIAEIGSERERVWRIYMLGSAQGFEQGEIGVYQTLAAREGAAPELPLDRSDLLV